MTVPHMNHTWRVLSIGLTKTKMPLIFDLPFWLCRSLQPLVPGTSPKPYGRPLNWPFLMQNRKRRGLGAERKRKINGGEGIREDERGR